MLAAGNGCLQVVEVSSQPFSWSDGEKTVEFFVVTFSKVTNMLQVSQGKVLSWIFVLRCYFLVEPILRLKIAMETRH